MALPYEEPLRASYLVVVLGKVNSSTTLNCGRTQPKHQNSSRRNPQAELYMGSTVRVSGAGSSESAIRAQATDFLAAK
jgi:hypothetical protein